MTALFGLKVPVSEQEWVKKMPFAIVGSGSTLSFLLTFSCKASTYSIERRKTKNGEGGTDCWLRFSFVNVNLI
jgi:hypothetical protein